jgi:RNA polymerase sigma factor (sigma-70 family)
MGVKLSHQRLSGLCIKGCFKRRQPRSSRFNPYRVAGFVKSIVQAGEGGVRERFAGYYPLTSEEFDELWRRAAIVLDANAMLNLHRYPETTREELLRLLDEVADRVWVPHQAALEYHRNHPGVVTSQGTAIVELQGLVDTTKNRFLTEAGHLKKRVGIDIGPLVELVSEALTEAREWANGQQGQVPRLDTQERTAERLGRILRDRIGPEYPLDRLAEIHGVAQGRFDQKVPPGFRDAKKEVPGRYGDVVMWYQILDYARETGRDVLLICDERKDDWFLEEQGQTAGPRPELGTEFHKETGRRFYMYSTEGYMQHAYQFRDETPVAEAIAGARDARIHPGAEDRVSPRIEPVDMLTALRRLPREHAEVMNLRYLRNMTLEETAETMGLSKNAVKRLQMNALTRLRRIAEKGEQGR